MRKEKSLKQNITLNFEELLPINMHLFLKAYVDERVIHGRFQLKINRILVYYNLVNGSNQSS